MEKTKLLKEKHQNENTHNLLQIAVYVKKQQEQVTSTKLL